MNAGTPAASASSLALPNAPGIRLLPQDPGPRFQTGALFALKMGILAATLLSCLVIYRPFCKYVCPLGAVYGALNPVALYRLRFLEDKCIRCGACARACKMCLDPAGKELNHPECVRCGDCVNVCPTDALSMGFGPRQAETVPGKELA